MTAMVSGTRIIKNFSIGVHHHRYIEFWNMWYLRNLVFYWYSIFKCCFCDEHDVFLTYLFWIQITGDGINNFYLSTFPWRWQKFLQVGQQPVWYQYWGQPMGYRQGKIKFIELRKYALLAWCTSMVLKIRFLWSLSRFPHMGAWCKMGSFCTKT